MSGLGKAFGVAPQKSKGKMKMVAPSKGHKPDGPHGKAAVAELGRKKTTGNFKRIEQSRGKGAAIAAFQNAKRSYDKKG